MGISDEGGACCEVVLVVGHSRIVDGECQCVGVRTVVEVIDKSVLLLSEDLVELHKHVFRLVLIQKYLVVDQVHDTQTLQ